MKKTISLFLVMVMCMALALPVFAGDATSTGPTTNVGAEYEGKVQTATIQVTAGTTGKVFLNPYNIQITKNSVVSGSGTTTIAPSVIAPTLVLTNQSNVPLKMSLTVTGVIPTGSTAKFLTTDTTVDTEKNHGVFMYIDVKNKGSLATAPTASDSLTSVADYTPSSVYSADNPNGTQAVVKAGAVKMTDFTTLAVPAANQQGYVTVDIGGKCASSPTDPWSDKDTVNVQFAFTFTATKNSGTSTGSGGT